MIILGIANLIALGALALTLLGSPSGENTLPTSPISAPIQQDCRRAVSEALLDRDQIGMVHTQQSGAILIQLQRPLANDFLRTDADGATWMALEIVANQSQCLRFKTVAVTITFTDDLPRERDQRAIAKVEMPDLVMWSLGQIDDLELSRRITYQPPGSAPKLSEPLPQP